MSNNPMAVVHEARRANLRLLAAKYDGPHNLADKLRYSRSFLSQLIGKNPSRDIGERTARAIETKLSLPMGWLDTARVSQ
ncbi:hypothetical protein CAL26_09895 [Bordetella genomosp. 9]|uniref:HTH cro/C1-type domain-containing protein n=1 Tax=Bordetella genomosp. 9 TaxID=1416803 RepID=A0A261RHD8_9BORD|nr:hypothetical protein [Bordetella genomosp. 9]OZI23733.1 hypothetical protein CAL26_09895 [Bordetella genomosp. 9]